MLNKNRVIPVSFLLLLFFALLVIIPQPVAAASYTLNGSVVQHISTGWISHPAHIVVTAKAEGTCPSSTNYAAAGIGDGSFSANWLLTLESYCNVNDHRLNYAGGCGSGTIIETTATLHTFDLVINWATTKSTLKVDGSQIGASNCSFFTTDANDLGIYCATNNPGNSVCSSSTQGTIQINLVAAGNILPSTEPYESYSTGATPTPSDYTYTQSSATGVVSTAQAHGGTKSLLYTATAATNFIRNQFSDNLCNSGNYVQYWMKLPSLPTSGLSTTALIAGTGILYPFALYVDSSGVLHGYDGLSTTTTIASGFPANQWVDIKLSVVCPSNVYTITSSVLGISASYDAQDFSGILNQLSFEQTGSNPSGGVSGDIGTSFFIDDLVYPGFGGGVYTGLTPAATSVAQTSITGFDILKNGFNVATRDGTGGSQLITVMDGQDLSQTANLATVCNRLHGLTNMGDMGWAYIHCDGSNNPNSIIFVNANGGTTYPFNPACSQPHYSCDGNIDMSGTGISSADRNALIDLVPGITGEFYGQSTLNSGILTGFNIAASESTGQLSDMNMGWSLKNDGTVTLEKFFATSIPDLSNLQDDICGYGNLRVFRSEAGTPVKGYTITLNNNPSSSSNQLPAPTFVQTYTGSVDALLTGQFIDCANDRIIVDSTTQLTIWNYATNSLVLTKAITGGSYNAISGNGSYAAYSDGTITHIISGTTGNQLAYLTNPGTLIDMEMDNCAQSLYLATSTNVYRYNIIANTTGTAVDVSSGSCVVSSGITPTSSTTTSSGGVGSSSGGIVIGGSSSTITNPFTPSDDNPFGLNITYISQNLHVSREGTQVLIGLVFVVIFAVWLWLGTESIVLAIIGAGLGLIVATIFGFINVWVILVVVLFLIVALGKMIFGGFTGGEE